MADVRVRLTPEGDTWRAEGPNGDVRTGDWADLLHYWESRGFQLDVERTSDLEGMMIYAPPKAKDKRGQPPLRPYGKPSRWTRAMNWLRRLP